MTKAASAARPGRPKVELAPRLRNSIATALRKVPNINKTVAAMAKKGYEVSAGKVREVATAEGIELARNVRLQQAPAVLKLAVQLRSKHWSASVISSEIEEQLGVKVSPHYVNTLIRRHAASLTRRASK